MNAHISHSIIMRIREFGESDLLVTFFTYDRGLLKGVAKGARKSRKRFPNCLDLFCLVKMEHELKRKGDLHFLHSCRLMDGFPGLRSDFTSLSLASYMVELTEVLFPVGVADRRMFELLKNSFFALNEAGNPDILRLLFEAKAMSFGGYEINFNSCCNCGRPYVGEGRAVFKKSKGGIACLSCERECTLTPGLGPDAVQALRLLQAAPWEKVEAISLAGEIIQELRPVLKLHMEYRIGRRLKSAEYLD